MKTKLYFLFFLFFSFLGWNSVESISEKLESCSTQKFFGNAIILLNGLGWVRGQVDLSCSCVSQRFFTEGQGWSFWRVGRKQKKKLVLKNLISCCHFIPGWNYNSLFLLGVFILLVCFLGFFLRCTVSVKTSCFHCTMHYCPWKKFAVSVHRKLNTSRW